MVSSGCPWLRRFVGVSASIVSFTSLGLAIYIFFEGAESVQAAHAMQRADEEFEPFNQTCTVKRIAKCFVTTPDANPPNTPFADRARDGEPHCWAKYSAFFYVPGQANTVYLTYPEFASVGMHDCGNTCDSQTAEGDDAGSVPSGSIESGHAYPCWKPKFSRVDAAYQCGNPACYKLADPYAVYAEAQEAATQTVHTGGGLAIAGLLLGCLSLGVWPSSGVQSRSSTTSLEVVSSSRQAQREARRELERPLTPQKEKPPTMRGPAAAAYVADRV